jgi:hypothetical protein
VKEESHRLWAAQVGLAPAEHRSDAHPQAGATASGFRLGPDGRLLLLADLEQPPALEGRAHGLRLEAGPPGLADFPQRASITDPAWRVVTEGTLAAAFPAGSDPVASGRFRLVAWDATFTLRNATGSPPVASGAFHEDVAGPAGRHVQREAVLEVEEGWVRLPGGSAFRLFVHAGRLELATGALHASDPAGTNPAGGAPVAGGARLLALDAPLAADLAPTGGQVAAGFPRPPQSATLDGVAVRAPTGGGPLAWGLALVGLAAVPLAFAAGSRAVLARRVRALDHLVQAQRFGQALDLARAIRRRRPRYADALVAESMGLLRLGRYPEAAAVLEAEGWTAALAPLRDCLRATAAAGQGRKEEAAARLAASLRDAPELAAHAAAHPLLAPILRRTPQGGGQHPHARP